MRETIINVDGACKYGQNDMRCSAGIFWGDNDPRNRSYKVNCSTNNRAELIAAYIAIKQSIELKFDKVIVKTDSQYVERIFTLWIKRWKRLKWYSTTRKPVKNQDLIKAIDGMRNEIAVDFIWVRGHDKSNMENAAAHNLAQKALTSQDTQYFNWETDSAMDQSEQVAKG